MCWTHSETFRLSPSYIATNLQRQKIIRRGKGISGKGRLTDGAINLLENYFGMVIRQNSDVPFTKKKLVHYSFIVQKVNVMNSVIFLSQNREQLVQMAIRSDNKKRNI